MLPLALYAALAAAYLPTIGTNPSPDVYTADFAAWHLARSGEPVPDIPDFPLLDDNVIRATWIVETADGREAVGRAPGVIAAVVPAYWLAERLAPTTAVSAVPGGVTAALLTAATVTLLFSLLRRHLRDREALLAAGLFGLATPMWSISADGVWPHTVTTLGIVGTAWAADRQRWWLAGVLGGVALWGRLHAALVWAVLGLGVAWARRRPGVAVRVGVASTALLALMSVWTRWMYGRWDPSSGYRAGDFTGNAAGNALDWRNFAGFLVSPDRGLLVWTPLVLLLLPALVRRWRDLPDWSRWLLAGGAAYTVAQGLLVRFSGGDQFYGYRTSLELLACATPALALSAPAMGRVARRLLAPVAVLQLVVVAPGAVVDGPYVLADDVWSRNAFLETASARPGVVAACAAAAAALALAWVAVTRGTSVPATTAPATSSHGTGPSTGNRSWVRKM